MMNNHNNNNNNNNNNSLKSIDSNSDSLKQFFSINSTSNNNNYNSIISIDSDPNPSSIETDNNINKFYKKTWKIVTQNIRGINDELKQQNWWKFCVENNLDIVAITET